MTLRWAGSAMLAVPISICPPIPVVPVCFPVS